MEIYEEFKEILRKNVKRQTDRQKNHNYFHFQFTGLMSVELPFSTTELPEEAG